MNNLRITDENELIGLDFETYGSRDLRKVGMPLYMEDEFFRPLIGCAVDGNNVRHLFDFVEDYDKARLELSAYLVQKRIAAHNVAFEMGVLRHLGIELPTSVFYDSAVTSRVAGGGSKLEVAAPQLLNKNKIDLGASLIQVFSVPGKYQKANNSNAFDPQITVDREDDWKMFIEYCFIDAELSYDIQSQYEGYLTDDEKYWMWVTLDMNETGWPVDRVLVEEMQTQFEKNKRGALELFQKRSGAPDLNLNSHPQLVAWCKERGVIAKSFDEQHVDKLLKAIIKKLPTVTDPDKLRQLKEVEDMLATKKILGGSSLSKLQKILDTTSADDRLRDQYLHCGATQTLRTTGRGVQMQNLPKLIDRQDIDTVGIWGWSNTVLSNNLRQVFAAESKKGKLIVGDFASVESRGLAWLAGEEWKLQAYRDGRDVYKELAMKIFGLPTVADVSDTQRTPGKVGELSCGYGAGPEAVRDFAAKMGVEMTLEEAATLVRDWRDACPATVALWDTLNFMLESIVVRNQRMRDFPLPDGYSLEFSRSATPASLERETKKLGIKDAQSVQIIVWDKSRKVVLRRIFHGCYRNGRNIAYFKPSELKGGPLWKKTYKDPKTGRQKEYELYGGKLAGILTQSLCRQIFFEVLFRVREQTYYVNNVEIVGQFHDEIVLHWEPPKLSVKPRPDSYPVERNLEDTCNMLAREMRNSPLPSLPMGAEVKYAHRYIK